MNTNSTLDHRLQAAIVGAPLVALSSAAAGGSLPASSSALLDASSVIGLSTFTEPAASGEALVVALSPTAGTTHPDSDSWCTGSGQVGGVCKNAIGPPPPAVGHGSGFGCGCGTKCNDEVAVAIHVVPAAVHTGTPEGQGRPFGAPVFEAVREVTVRPV